jgi:fanconi anemia group D2 protein
MATSATLCAIFRLVRILRWLVDGGTMEEIDAVLGCAVFMPEGLLDIDRGTFVSMTDPLEQVCVLNTLFISVNWFRELVNAFCVTEDPIIKEKVVEKY